MSHKIYYTELAGKGLVSPPPELLDNKGWTPDDELVFESSDVCTDDGDYQSVYIRNITLEKRLQDVKNKDKS
jgi:hypothetical protein